MLRLSSCMARTLCWRAWKPIVWNEAEHYPQWLAYPSREGRPPQQGSQLMLAEHPGRTYVATSVESGADPVLAWLKPLPHDRSRGFEPGGGSRGRG
jgi:hypothetical protein